jgi:CubicO group peptidase (beta-lactamase class C family)
MTTKETSPQAETKLAALLDKYASRPDTGPVSFALSSPSRGWSWSYPSGASPKPYFTASITKLYTAAIVMQLRQEGLVELGDSIADYLDIDTVAGLNTFHGSEHSAQITVKDLLAHTSGIAGYFDQKRRGGGTLLNEILSADRSWSVNEALDIAKRDMSPRFAPGTPGKAFYSDANYYLLGLIIEKLTGGSWEQAVKDRILAPLALDDTWAFRASDADRYDDIAPMLYGRATVRIPLAMASVRAHGGLVSTAEDGLTFLEAFIGGALFDPAYLAQMRSDWRRIFFPLQYGTGMMRYAIPRFLSPGPGPRDYVGHSGSSGTVLFHAPSADLYVSGNISQIKNRSLVYRLTSRLGALAT